MNIMTSDNLSDLDRQDASFDTLIIKIYRLLDEHTLIYTNKDC